MESGGEEEGREGKAERKGTGGVGQGEEEKGKGSQGESLPTVGAQDAK